MITDHHCMIEKKKLLKATMSHRPITTITTTTTTTTTGIFIVKVTNGYQFFMNVRIILINCNRNVNRTIVFLILIYWWVGNSTSDFQHFG